MKRHIPFIILFLSFIRICLAAERDDLLKELDLAVNKRAFFMKLKESRIDSLRNLLQNELPWEEHYRINNAIFKEYTTYRADSAMRYVFINKELADQYGIRKHKDEVTMNLSLILSNTGLYRESIDNLKKINSNLLDPGLLYDYYYTSEWTYYAAGEYSNDLLYTPQYREIERAYTDSVFSVLDPHSDLYTYYRGKKLVIEGKLEEALNLFMDVYPGLEVNTRLYAIITFDIANIYHRFGSMDLYEKFLILAAISDQVCPLKENLAMQDLSLYLFRNKPDDLDRAYRYIQCSMEDAHFYNNRLRIVQISEKLPIIVQAFQEKSEKEKSRITSALLIITLLSIGMIALLGYVYKQMRLVKKSRHELQSLNGELNLLNSKLNDANHTKEEYVGLFIDLCSSYIDKLDKYREMVKRKLMTKQIDDLYKMVNSTRHIETELEDFFHSFDNAFLKLYPTFIEEFNRLLTEDEKILPKKGDLLNRELRIFALIRLGINDSSRIASFLRYSPQTIYNNRTKVRNKAKNRKNFEKDILAIGI